MSARLWALVGCVTEPVYRRTRWRWARRLDDAIYGRHLAALTPAARTPPEPRPRPDWTNERLLPEHMRRDGDA